MQGFARLAGILATLLAIALAKDIRAGESLPSAHGRGWFRSPAGAVAARPDAAGMLEFRFSVRERGTTPDGSVQLRLTAADLHVEATDVEWLVVAGSRATLKAHATLNGTAGYELLITVVDASYPARDRIRVRVAKRDSNLVIYDNHANAPLESDVGTEIDGGSIAVYRNGVPDPLDLPARQR